MVFLSLLQHNFFLNATKFLFCCVGDLQKNKLAELPPTFRGIPFSRISNQQNYCFVSFEDGSDINKVWTYFKISNVGAITWAMAEITEKEFDTGPYKHNNSIVIELDKYFHEIEKDL